MALKGTLKDFSVADIFQLIGHQQKSGSLYVRTKEKEAHIVFDQGLVVLGTFRKSDEDFLLGTMLLRAGVISAEQLTKAIENQRVTMRSLGDILKSEKIISSGTLGEFVQLQLKEVLFRLFQWKDGLYEFVPEKIQFNKAIIKPQSAEAVLMDGFRMLDEWPGVMEKVGSLESVFRSLAEPEQLEAQNPFESDGGDIDLEFDLDGGSEKEEKKESTPSMSSDERKILLLLDGHRSLQECVYLSRLGTFDTARTIADLMSKDLAMKMDQVAHTRVVSRHKLESPENIKSWLSTSIRPLLAAFAASLLIPILAFGVRSHWGSRYVKVNPEKGRTYETPASLSLLLAQNEKNKLKELLEIYRLQYSRYPTALAEVIEETIASRWNYEVTHDHYLLNNKRSLR